MRHLDIEVPASGRTAEDVYTILSDFERYPQHASAVRTVRVRPVSDGSVLSSWEVMFRTGLLRWTEEDHFEPETYTIRFRQTEGDIEHFAGQWRVYERPDGGT